MVRLEKQSVDSRAEIDREELRRIAEAKYSRREFSDLKPILDVLIDSPDSELLDKSFLLYRARLSETGDIGYVDLRAAFADFEEFHSNFNSSFAMLGMARVLMKMDQQNYNSAIELYKKVIQSGSELSVAYMNWARISHEVLRDNETAKQKYLRAFYKGEAQGLLQYSMLCNEDDQPFKALGSLLMYLVARPILGLFRRGKSSPYGNQ